MQGREDSANLGALKMVLGERWPRVGERMIKSALAVFFCLIIYMLRGGQDSPFYATIAAVLCMQPDVGSLKETAKRRVFGTLLGAFFGIVAIYIQAYVLGSHQVLYYIFISLMIIVVIYTTLLFKKPAASYFSCVVFLSVTVVSRGGISPLIYVANRVIDTLVGIFVSIAVNKFHLPKKRHPEILFVSGLDDTLLTGADKLTPYGKVELNRMIGEGANFTIATERTPAALLDAIKDIRIKLPVVAMSGAVLYDVKENHFVKVCSMSWEDVKRVTGFLNQEGFHYFSTVITDNVVLIYFDDFKNDAQRQNYASLRKSPYRNYINQPLREGQEVVYFMVLDTTERVKALYRRIRDTGVFAGLRVVVKKAEEYPGHLYLRVYSREATKSNMINEVKKMVNAQKVITFGSIPGAYDYVLDNGDSNIVVKTIKKEYEPVWRPGSRNEKS